MEDNGKSEKPPFGWTILWGKKKAGKTLTALNSPWGPVHIVDSENSSADYFQHQSRLIELGVLHNTFTRVSVTNLNEFIAEATRITNGTQHYGTIAVDTMGQVANWLGENQFQVDKAIADKQSQVVWGRIRDRIRKLLISLGNKCDLLVLTAHERKYNNEISPRCNPAVLELASMSIQLVRAPNQKIPTGVMAGARLPFFPPQIKDFGLEKLVEYIQKPANWDKLKKDEKVIEEPAVPVLVAPGGFSEEVQYEAG